MSQSVIAASVAVTVCSKGPITKVFTKASHEFSLSPNTSPLAQPQGPEGASGVEVFVLEDGGVVDVGVAPAVEVLRVAVYAVAAVDIRHGGGHGGDRVGGRAEGLWVGQVAPELDAVLVPVPPQYTLHL